MLDLRSKILLEKKLSTFWFMSGNSLGHSSRLSTLKPRCERHFGGILFYLLTLVLVSGATSSLPVVLSRATCLTVFFPFGDPFILCGEDLSPDNFLGEVFLGGDFLVGSFFDEDDLWGDLFDDFWGFVRDGFDTKGTAGVAELSNAWERKGDVWERVTREK